MHKQNEKPDEGGQRREGLHRECERPDPGLDPIAERILQERVTTSRPIRAVFLGERVASDANMVCALPRHAENVPAPRSIRWERNENPPAGICLLDARI